MTERPRWFLVVAVLALIWNLLGCAAYLADVTMSPEQVAQMPEEQRELYRSRPAWGVAATAIAVWFGAAGSLTLVLRRRWATPLLALSLAGIVVQDVDLFVLGDAAAAAGPGVYVLQGLVLGIGIALVILARHASRAGWLR